MKGVIIALLLLPFASRAETKWHEADYVDHYCKGEIEHVLPDRTRIDCLTDTHAIEFDFANKWADSLGQALFYSAMTGKKGKVILIVKERTKARYLKRIETAIEYHKLDIEVDTVAFRH
ncbi:hypothetical protein [Vibrio nigripulchritudo]|uniref:hypothetical protein n=1 Tax=Vibrio nigripulchritudo TaxID=28173 RepID=UPI002492DD53|nr:hypothetical protein [Vibrio nigripulchritudo]BDU38713.1 hypothetical protein TUMSATVNIG2_31820 [Vibrio nigripulchritudo]BDU44433.1 hypothetical protein TUMSATVNIG3_32310 [Vibrio nigripulchritudo]